MRRKKFFSLFLALGIITSIGTIYSAPQKESEAAQQESSYIVMLEGKGNIDELRETCEEDYNATETETVSELGEAYLENYVVCKLSALEASELAETEDVIVEKDKTITACASELNDGNVNSSDLEWNVQMVGANEESIKTGKNKIKVAVLDSGVDDFNDLQLAGSINLIPGEEEVLPLFWDVTGHGSSVAGIIAAEKNDVGITGIAPEVELYAAKILDDKNQAPVSRVINGIYWAIENNVNIINMSFGMKQNSAALHKAIQDAYSAGILLVAAAGNGENIEYPAAYDEVIAVGSVDTSGTVSEKSATGDELELAAPGEQICSTGAFEGTLICAGTSMAAPHVTAVAAKLWEKDTTVSAEFIRQLLAASANGCGAEDEYGYGLIDLAYANEIYADFKADYVEGASLEINKNNIEENKNNILNFDEVDYVEGRWSGNIHQSAINTSIITSAQNQKILKAGIIYPDKEKSGLKGKTTHPGWHGWFKRGGTSEEYLWNYIQCYIYETRLANKLGDGVSIGTATIPSGMSTEKANELVNDVTNINFSKWLKQDLGIDVSAKSKMLFVWGMALHNATDTFAHSTCGYVNNQWTFLTDDSPNRDADNIDVCEGRMKTALWVAKSGLQRYKAGKAGAATDFNPTGGYNQVGEIWKVKYLKKFADVINTDVGTALKPYSYLKINNDGTLELDS